MNRLLFEKTGRAVFISHLDLMRIFQRAFRRGSVMLKHSQGFTPHAYVSILIPLSVGVASKCEILEFELDEAETTPIDELSDLLNKTLPDGIRVLKAYQSDRKAKHLTHLHADVALEYDNGVAPGALKAVQELFALDEILMDKRTKSGEIAVQNIRPMIKTLSLSQDVNEIHLDCTVCAQNPSLNPLQLAKAVEKYLPQFRPDFARCMRLEFLEEDGTPFF